MKTKYFNNGRCRVLFDLNFIPMAHVELLVRHSYLRGFVWFYKWHEIGVFYFNPTTESAQDLQDGIKSVFNERKQKRIEARNYKKINELRFDKI